MSGRSADRRSNQTAAIDHSAWRIEVGPSRVSEVFSAAWYMEAARTTYPENAEGPETQCFRAFQLVAGAGFEPATFGL